MQNIESRDILPKLKKSGKTSLPHLKTGGRLAPPSRYPAIDMLRGIAIVLMIAYHFTFDLNYFGLVQFDFNTDPFWLSARALILSLFLGLVGVSLQIFYARGFNGKSYLKRLGLIAGSAALVSYASYLMFPQTFIFFGVLHFIAVASVIALLFVRFYVLNLLLGGVFIFAGLWFKHPFFDQTWAQWIGFMTYKPLTEDYVPIFPWFGVVLIGLFFGSLIGKSPRLKMRLSRGHEHKLGRALITAGRHSLIIYLAHQPILIALIYFFIQFL